MSVEQALEAGAVDAGELGETIEFHGQKRLDVLSGCLEVFPNAKQLDSDYKPIRLPFTGQGNGMLVNMFGVVEEPGALPPFWREAASHNSVVKAIRISKREPGAGPYNLSMGPNEDDFISVNWIYPRPRVPPSSQVVYAVKGEESSESVARVDGLPRSCQEAQSLVRRGWTNHGQTQSLMLAALMLAGQQSDSPGDVADLVKELLVNAPGFTDWCSHVDQIESGELPGRAACRKAARFTPAYVDTWKQRANRDKADAAQERARAVIAAAHADGLRMTSINKLIHHLRTTRGGPSRAWWFRPHNQKFLQQLQSLLVSSPSIK